MPLFKYRLKEDQAPRAFTDPEHKTVLRQPGEEFFLSDLSVAKWAVSQGIIEHVGANSDPKPAPAPQEDPIEEDDDFEEGTEVEDDDADLGDG